MGWFLFSVFTCYQKLVGNSAQLNILQQENSTAQHRTFSSFTILHSQHLFFCSIFPVPFLVPQEFMLPIAGTKLVIFFFFPKRKQLQKDKMKQNTNYQVVFEFFFPFLFRPIQSFHETRKSPLVRKGDFFQPQQWFFLHSMGLSTRLSLASENQGDRFSPLSAAQGISEGSGEGSWGPHQAEAVLCIGPTHHLLTGAHKHHQLPSLSRKCIRAQSRE